MTVGNDKFPLDSDRPWLEANQPGLMMFTAKNGDIIVKGQLSIHHEFNGHVINDSYKVRVTLRKASSFQPIVVETGGRLDAVKDRRGLDNVDLHMYNNDHLCLMAPQQMELVFTPNKSLRLLVDSYLIPYFYSQSYFDTHDGNWLWPHYAHNLAGLLEWYRENYQLPGAAKSTQDAIRKLEGKAAGAFIARGMRKDSFSLSNKCLCGSKRSYLRCHASHGCYAKLAQAIRFGR